MPKTRVEKVLEAILSPVPPLPPLPVKKTTALRRMIVSTELEFIMEAHNGLSAKIVEEAGFKGIWGSGLSISAALGVRDNNEASWTQILEVLEFMSDATSIPILLDGDTGYGNFNNMRRLVKKLEQRGVAGVCIEDKLFPKTNSFIDGEQQPLADISEFAGKIKAGKDAQSDPDFCIVARVEAFIAGWGLEEALKRAEAYRLAGADAILMHSKKADPSDIEAFMREWGGRHPVVIVPTKYYSTPTNRFRELGISMVIWANHNVRASVAAMRSVTEQIKKEESLTSVESKVATVNEIFRLQGEDELSHLEERYLPKTGKQVKTIVLAASRGSELGALTADKPKALLEISGQPILKTLITDLNEVGVKDITVVRGYKKDLIQGQNFKTVDNDEHEDTKDLYSLYLAREALMGDTLILYGDTLFRRHLLSDALRADGDVVIVADADTKADGRLRDCVYCTKPYTNDFFNRDIQLTHIAARDSAKAAHGEWTGVISATARGSEQLLLALEELSLRPDFKQLTLVDLLAHVKEKHGIAVVYTKGGWIDVDIAQDIERAGAFSAP